MIAVAARAASGDRADPGKASASPAALLAAIAAIATIAPLAALAQDTTTIPIDTLTVTVTRGADVMRVPAAISLIDGERIQAGRLGVTLDEVLVDVPGVFVNNRYNFALGTRISIRGAGARAAFGVRGIRLIQDGIPLTVADGQSSLNNIDLTAAGRIEVLRGAAALLHGNAAGGVIDIRTETPAIGFALSANVAGVDLGRSGITDLARASAKIGGGSARTRYLVSMAHITGAGAREHARFEQTNLNARLEQRTSTARTAITINVADAPVAQNPGSLPRDSALLKPGMAWPRNVATGAGEASRQFQGGVEHARAIGEVRLNAVVHGTARTLDNPLPFAYITLDRKAGGIRSTASWRTLTAGIDVEVQRDARAEYENSAGRQGAQRRNQTDRIWSVAPFLRTVLPLTERTSLTIGARYDRARFAVDDHFLADGRDDSGRRTLDALSPGIGVTHAVARDITLFANLATSFQTPTTTELINAPPAPGQPCCAAGFNERLEPERGRSLEMGVRAARAGRFRFDAAAYYITVRDALVSFQVAAAEGRDYFRNAGRTRNVGFELAGNVTLTRILHLTTSYTFSDFVFVDDGDDTAAFEGNRVPGVPPHHWLVRPSLSTRAVVIDLEADVTSSYYADDANSAAARNRGVAVINLRARSARPLGDIGLTPFLAVNNLTDRKYSGSVVINAAGARYFEPAPGRNFFVGMAFLLGRSGNER